MANSLKIDGIYDSRTLKFLQSIGIQKFGFSFDPRSFNFIQEYVFIEQIIPLISSREQLTLNFTRSSDPMIPKVLLDLKRAGITMDNVALNCLEWSEGFKDFNVGFYLNYKQSDDKELALHSNCKGFIFDYSLFDQVHSEGLLQITISNIFTKLGRLVTSRECILATDWHDNIFPGLPEFFDFDTLSLPVNSDIEICYRNVDLKKLGKELDLHSLRKAFQSREKF